MDTKGPHLHRKITTLNSIKQDLMKLRSKYISLLDTEKRVHAEISKEKSEKNCLYLSLVSVEEEANKSRNALNQLENEFLLQRDTMVMNYVGKRAELCTQASLY